MYYDMDTESTVVDLTNYTVTESSLWLMYKLNFEVHTNDPYALPFVNYLLSWERSVPLKAIILAQSPYPNNIFPFVAAAMSYDTELCENCKNISGNVPPTVEILANDLFVNAQFDKQNTISLLRDGWQLVDHGILLVNECIFAKQNTAESYIESVSQCSLIIRLLKESEKHGKSTVQLFALGTSGQRMASDLCSWYKSSTITLSKRAVTHPAAVSRRFNNFNDPKCHLGDKAFSKKLATLLSNCVASMHTMSHKTSAVDLKIRKIADIYDIFSKHMNSWGQDTNELINSLKEVKHACPMEHKEFTDSLERAITNLQSWATKTTISSTLSGNLQSMSSQTISGYVSKPAPSLGFANPTPSVISSNKPTASVVSSQVSFRKKPSINQTSSNVNTESSSIDKVTPPASVISVSTVSGNTAEPIQFRKRVQSTTSIATSNSNIISNESPVTPQKSSAITSKTPSTSASNIVFRKRLQTPTASSEPVTPSKEQKVVSTPGKVKESKDMQDTKGFLRLTKNQINNLSCIRAIVEAHKEGVENDTTVMNDLEVIEDDIAAGQVINNITQRFINAIDIDYQMYPDFDFAKWFMGNDKPSATLEQCKEEFDF